MKNTILALLIIFISCQDKKDEESGPLVGTWKLIEMGKYTCLLYTSPSPRDRG